MIPRPLYINKILPYVDTPFVKILSGVRRCGKSTILRMMVDELKKRGIPDQRILVYNFDSLRHEAIKTARLFYEDVSGRLAPEGRSYLFLDEIQEVEEWEKAVNSLMNDFMVDIYVTGSNSRLLAAEMATVLTGRYVSFRVFPLSFAEYLVFRGEYGAVGEPRAELARYLRLGGFPAVHLKEYTPDESYTIVKDIYNSTIFTDIVRSGQVRRVDQLERIVKFVLDNLGRTFSAASIARYLKSERRTIDNETVYEYLRRLESAFIIHRCLRYDLQGKELLKTQEKFYLADVALRHSVLGYTPDGVAAALENLVYLELLRRGYDVFVGKLASAEIDFVATRRDERLYIQIAQRIERDVTERREYDRLLAIADNYPKYVLVADELSGGNYQGIKTMSVAGFLLADWT